MLELISIHIPKTGGRSFYHVLKQVYGEEVSISYERKDYKAVMAQYGGFEESIADPIRAVHGHLYYREVRKLHKQSGAKVICWLRDPVERVVSNYHYFINRLKNRVEAGEAAVPDAHRTEESLLEYAARRDTRNRMSKFLKGIKLEDLHFIGFLEHYDEDLHRLQELMGWGEIDIPHLNRGKRPKREALDNTISKKLCRWNRRDIKLYDKAKALTGY